MSLQFGLFSPKNRTMFQLNISECENGQTTTARSERAQQNFRRRLAASQNRIRSGIGLR